MLRSQARRPSLRSRRATGSVTSRRPPPSTWRKRPTASYGSSSRHAGLVVNSDLQILHFRGDTSPYLRPVPGKATFQLLRMVREELVLELRGAINKARKTRASVKREAVRVRRNGDFHLVNIEVRPLPSAQSGRPILSDPVRGSRPSRRDAEADTRTAGRQRERRPAIRSWPR